MTFLASGCAALDALNATPAPIIMPTASPTPGPTSTIIWFPPSVTPSAQAFSTYPPTPEMRPGLGEVFFTDDFSDEEAWDTPVSDQASAVVENNRFILAAQSNVYMISLRRDLVADDFYAEITARPNLCRGDDSYGLLVRANAVAYYRFAVSCNGTVNAERISVGKRQTLQAPIPSGDAPPGAPGEVRIGVWAAGTEMRLFLNGRYQFSVNDANYPSGAIGVFINSAGETAAVISFSDLTLQTIDHTAPTNTLQP